jgi:ssDNA-binding Zn-finger/Zn-ribbon topoisomerase 1
MICPKCQKPLSELEAKFLEDNKDKFDKCIECRKLEAALSIKVAASPGRTKRR